MEITLSHPFRRNGHIADYDMKQMKKALNRLGYYQPFAKVGITGIADKRIFDALSEFQKDYKLPVTDTVQPDDETIKILNRETAKTPDGYYIWRSVEDSKVRGAHASYNRTIRAWKDDPDSGEEFNCRCWAERIDISKIPVINFSEDRIKSILDDTPAIFEIQIDPKATSKAPSYEDVPTAREALLDNDAYIEIAAKKHSVDPDLIRAIMWAENARGGYFGSGYGWDKLKITRTAMPMNVYVSIWHSLISQNKDDLYDPKKNVEAGAILLKRISQRIISENCRYMAFQRS